MRQIEEQLPPFDDAVSNRFVADLNSEEGCEIRGRTKEMSTLRAIGMQPTSVPLPVEVQFVLLSGRLIILPQSLWAFRSLGLITALETVVTARLKPVSAMAHAG